MSKISNDPREEEVDASKADHRSNYSLTGDQKIFPFF